MVPKDITKDENISIF